MHDARRSAVSGESLPAPLKVQWIHRAAHAPDPAWPLSEWNEAKVVFDRVYHPVVAGGRLFYGSSADGKVYCLDAASGEQLWAYYTGGPVRIAPTVWEGKVYVASDDGFAYCLSARSGALIWKRKGAVGAQRALGNGKMISMWPVRTGVLVDRGVAYFAAGLFPTEGTYIHAVDAKTGRVIWTNDSSGAIYMLHAHGGYDGFAGISPQGAMLADKHRLFIAMGRNVPAALDRKTGKLLYWRYLESHRITARDGGAALSLAEGLLFTAAGNTTSGPMAACFDAATGNKLFGTYAQQMIVTPRRIFLLERKDVRCVDKNFFKEDEEIQKKLTPVLKQYLETWPKPPSGKLHPIILKYRKMLGKIASKRRRGEFFKWSVHSDSKLEAFALAGDVLYAGGAGRVFAVDTRTGKKTWESPVDGAACGLAVANGRLYVSTDKGKFYCFGKNAPAKPKETGTKAAENPYAKDALSPRYESAAESIIKLTGITRGFCLVLDGGTGRLAYELAKRTQLQIYCLVADRAKAAVARKHLDKGGLYGRRVMVDVRSGGDLPYPDYFANLIVSDRAAATGEMPPPSREYLRVLKPCGGVMLMGQAAPAGKSIDKGMMTNWLEFPESFASEIIEENGTWLKVTRGSLPGSGEWTHQFANPAGTGCSEDRLVKAPFKILWFGKPGPAKTYKANTPCPLSTRGRIFVARTPVQAYDAYNGLKLWEAPINDVELFAATDEELYLTIRKTPKCLRLDTDTGRTLSTFKLPPLGGADYTWAFLAVKDNLLFATGLSRFELDKEDKAREEAVKNIPALKKELDRAPVRLKLHCGDVWTFYRSKMKGVMSEMEAKLAGVPAPRIANYKERMKRIIAGTASRYLCAMDRKTGKTAWVYAPANGAYICHASIAVAGGRVIFVEGRETGTRHTSKHLIALDMASGKKLWEHPANLRKYCRACSFVDSTELLAVACKDDIVVLSEIWAGTSVFAVSAKDGSLLWKAAARFNNWQSRRPVVVGNGVYTDYKGLDLRTGKELSRVSPITGRSERWQFERSGGCGGSTSSAHTIFFRSSSISYVDLASDQGLTNLSGVRPGCWINIVPAAGLVLVPEQSRGCICAFPIKASVVLAPAERHRAWSLIKLEPEQLPVRHLALNLGAPGDRRDAQGTLWLGYPRPTVGHGYKFQLPVEVAPGMGFYAGAPDGDGIEGTDKPWIFTSGVRGLKKITIPVDKAGEKPSLFEVGLFFVEPVLQRAGKRVFDVVFQGRTFDRNFDVFKAARGRGKAIRKTYRVRAKDKLAIELRSKTGNADTSGAPILNAVEIKRLSGR